MSNGQHAERIAKLEQWSSNHEDTYTIEREEHRQAHAHIWVQLDRISARLWWIMGLIVAGFASATYAMWTLLAKYIGNQGIW